MVTSLRFLNIILNYDDTAPEVSATSSGMNDKSVFMLDEKKGILYYTDGGE